jgi:hypothetical protein
LQNCTTYLLTSLGLLMLSVGAMLWASSNSKVVLLGWSMLEWSLITSCISLTLTLSLALGHCSPG